MHVCAGETPPLCTRCVHAVIVLGLREMPCVSMYRREGEGDGARQW